MLTSVFIITILSSIVLSDTDTDAKVVILNRNSFNGAVKTNEYILVNFYAEWCGHSKAFAPEYKKLAKKVSEMQLPITIAEIEESDEDELLDKYSIVSFPTLVLFRSGAPITYDEDRNVEEIIKWLQSQVTSAVTEITTIEA